ncbi:nucleotidyltransferase family protein [Granulicella sibirica]|uniref:Nucleotidyltransferase family protein n=1 Tax=Granulicella sibirica TaxID=2479048 RepID=A0A4Q0SWA9_9BACT|nr:nucleotidyltransferase family protein [Granulicella sibirica]RXH54200.1 hypothetical protein GRAN_4851 [Granulicella sibirica]
MQRDNKPSRISRRQAVQLAVLRSFTNAPAELDRLLDLSPPEWKRLLYWLDVSGLALYFFVRLPDLGLAKHLPLEVLERLQQNVTDNSMRMKAMAAEAVAIQMSFKNHGLECALLKGFSLWPHSVPSFELRSQLDIDFLVAPSDLASAQAIVAQRGYHLRGHSGRSWEYKDEPVPRTSIKQLYQDTGSRSVELHAATTSASQAHLRRRESLPFQGILMPVLSPEDLFLGQALHLYKHLASEGARAAHGVELYRHILYRWNDRAFWGRLRVLTEEDAGARFALGFVVALLTGAMGPFAPEALTSWTTERLPEFAHRWIDRFGLSAALGNAGGSKLSMILQDELEAHGLRAAAPKRQKVLPTRLPPRIEQAVPGETFAQSLGRNKRQSLFVLRRLRFHVIEGARLAFERARWKGVEARHQQTNDNSLTHA